MERHFNFWRARDAQEKYCDEHDLPHFAPFNGICENCFANIYVPVERKNGAVLGISVEEAGSRLISGCPHCNHSFCE